MLVTLGWMFVLNIVCGLWALFKIKKEFSSIIVTKMAEAQQELTEQEFSASYNIITALFSIIVICGGLGSALCVLLLEGELSE